MDVQPDDLRLFDALPTPHLLLDADLVVVQVNPAYARLVGVSAGELAGRHVLEAFPPRPAVLGRGGAQRLQRCLEHVLATGAPEVPPGEPYAVADPRDGRAAERRWSSLAVPVLDESGDVELILQRVEETTEHVHDRRARRRRHRAEERWRTRAMVAESEVLARVREARAAREAERARARELAALADAAVRVAAAEDVDELTDVLVNRALAALGAQGGAVAVREGDVVRLSITASLGDRIQVLYSTLPLDSPLPAAVSAATGRRILLRDRAQTVAYGHGAEEIVVNSGCQAWACLPLTTTGPGPAAARSVVLGSLLIGWSRAQAFTPAELDVLDAFAAQCAQALARIRAREAQRVQAEQTAQLAQALQRALLSEPVHAEGLDVVTRYRPAAQHARVGGDWCDSFVTPRGDTTLVVGDVCGHDREAAATMGQVRSMLRALAYTVGEPPAGVLRLLDAALRGLVVQAPASAVVVSVERDASRGGPWAHRLRWSNAGHPPPLLIHPDGRTELLRSEAELLLGVDADTPRSDHEADLAPGATLLLYTDGLVERRDSDLDAGLAWLARTAGALTDAGLGPAALCDALLEQVAGTAEDDVVLLALRVRGAGPALTTRSG
ncbi:SpoIIE family protein phosphatase [Kineococcus esterisolvens]|uniref:SpoIIE family protein phosphatase n=1 Tax=unclassified Kineococcus TaxID=2621656 RepID=UPI003D7DC84D